MFDGVGHDVGNVRVDQRVGDLAATTLRGEEVRRSEDGKVLRNQRLCGAGGFDEIVDAARPVGDRCEQLESQWVRHGFEQIGCFGELHKCIVTLQCDYVNP